MITLNNIQYKTIQQALNAGDVVNGSQILVSAGNYYEDLYLRNNINITLSPGVVLYGQHSDNDGIVIMQFNGNGILRTWGTANVLNIINPNSRISIICNQFAGSISANNSLNTTLIAGNNFGNSSTITGTPNSIIIGKNNIISGGDYDIVAGNSCTANGSYNLEAGSNNSIYGLYNAMVGNYNSTSGTNVNGNVIGGVNNYCNYNYNIIGGNANRNSGAGNLVIGNGNTANANYCIVAGQFNNIASTATNSFIGGSYSFVNNQNSFAFGSGVQANADGSYIFGKNGTNNNPNSFAFACLHSTLSGVSHSSHTTSSDYTIKNSDYIIIVDDSFSPITIYLPDPGSYDGQTFVIKEKGTVGIQVSSGHNLIDGNYNYNMNTQWSILKVIWDSSASQWYTIL